MAPVTTGTEFNMRPLFQAGFVAVVAGIVGCSAPAEPEETRAAEAAIHGVPTLGAIETVASFDPFMGQSPENVTIQGHNAWVISLLSNEILRVNLNSGSILSVPVAVPPGTFMAGIETACDKIIFGSASFGPFGPDHSAVFSLDRETLAVTQIAQVPLAAFNGLAVREGRWYAVEALGSRIYSGSIDGGAVSVWYDGPAVSPDPGYVPTPCNPPFPVGGNGLRLVHKDEMEWLMVSNTTRQEVSWIRMLPDGSSGDVEKVLSLNGYYPDDVWAYRHGAVFVATHGQHVVAYVASDGTATPLMDGLDCDGPTAVVVRGSDMYVTCGGDPLICRPNEEGLPDPSIVGPGQPALKRVHLH